MKNNKTPSIRFKGFTDPWEQRKFEDVTFLSGEKNKNNLPFESYSVTNENGFVPQNEQFENGGTMATADKRMYYIVSKNSFAYNPARINVGSIGYYDGSENVIVSSLYEVFKTSEDIDDRYLWHWFKSNNFKKLIEQYQEGGVRLYFYYDKLCMCSLPTPSIQEQVKIGRYFDNLDNLITLHQRKYDKLQNIKKSMLEKMFPKNGSNVPEIRFSGFTDPWEQRKFEDVTFLSGEKNKNNLPFESYSVTNENGFVPQNEQFENGGTMATADKRMYYIVSKNSFAYNPARINVGSIGYYDGSENVIVSSLYEVFKTSEDIDDRYLWHWFKSNNFKKLIEQYQEGGVRLYFYYDKLCMCSLPTPSIQEQVKIGRYFDNLDNLITLHQRELEKLQNIKKSMLEKMFV